MPTQTGGLSSEVLSAALEGLEAQSRKIDEHIQKVRSLLGIGEKRRGRPPKSEAEVSESPAAGTRRRFSAATRARMRDAQQKRWAALKGEQKAAAPAKKSAAKAAPAKRRLSAAGRKRIIEATKKRWAEYKAKKAEAAS